MRSLPVPQRARLEIGSSSLELWAEDGCYESVPLDGARLAVEDAALAGRFVGHASVYGRERRHDLITPPEDGAIAPRAARLPHVPSNSLIVARDAWEAMTLWLAAGGRLGAQTIGDLARIAVVSTAQFAIAIGECAAQRALDLARQPFGPLRCGLDVDDLLRPLEWAARTSNRARDAWLAALSRTAAV